MSVNQKTRTIFKRGGHTAGSLPAAALSGLLVLSMLWASGCVQNSQNIATTTALTTAITGSTTLSPDGSTADPATTDPVSPKANKTYISTVYPITIAAMNIAAGIAGVEVVSLTGNLTGCLHDYQLTTENMKRLEEADALIVNGAGLEGYLDQVASSYPDLTRIEASTGIPLLDGNPHVWVSVSLMIRQVQNITAGMISFDPEHAARYRINADAYLAKLENLSRKMHNELDDLPNRDIITFHEAFPYFAQEFNLNIVGVVEREPDSQPSAAELAETIDLIRSLSVKAVFVEPQYSSDTAQTISLETGAGVWTLDPASSGPFDLNAYLDIMETNSDTLVKALGGE